MSETLPPIEATEGPITAPRWRQAVLLLLVLTLAVTALVVWRWRDTHFDWKRFFATLTAVAGAWLAVSMVLMLLTYVGRALRWEVMLRPLRPHASLWNLC